MNTKKNKHSLLAAIQHSNLKEGEFVVKLNGEWFVGNLTAFEYTQRADSPTLVKLEGFLK